MSRSKLLTITSGTLRDRHRNVARSSQMFWAGLAVSKYYRSRSVPEVIAQCTVGNRGWSFVDFAGFAATLPRSF
jgi:hypothetical protein